MERLLFGIKFALFGACIQNIFSKIMENRHVSLLWFYLAVGIFLDITLREISRRK